MRKIEKKEKGGRREVRKLCKEEEKEKRKRKRRKKGVNMKKNRRNRTK